MRTRTVTERIGENMGPIDWSYDFLQHFDTMCCDDAGKAERCERNKEWLRQAEEAVRDGKCMEMTTYGGWPRCAWGTVIEVGMYDGWPYWKPTPSIRTTGPLGAEWHCFSMFTDVRTAETVSAAEGSK